MSARTVAAVYFSPGVGWVANIKQGCIVERHILLKRSQNVYDDQTLEAEMRERAEKLVSQ